LKCLEILGIHLPEKGSYTDSSIQVALLFFSLALLCSQRRAAVQQHLASPKGSMGSAFSTRTPPAAPALAEHPEQCRWHGKQQLCMQTRHLLEPGPRSTQETEISSEQKSLCLVLPLKRDSGTPETTNNSLWICQSHMLWGNIC